MLSETVELDSMTEFDFEEFFVRLVTKLDLGQVDRLILAEGKRRDILVKSPTGLLVAQCILHPDGNVSRPTVKKFRSTVLSNRGSKGMLVTTGHFTRDAVSYAQRATPPIELVDWSRLAEMSSRAGIVIVSNGQRLSIWTYPIPDPELTRTCLGKYVDSILQGAPRIASSLLSIDRRTVQYQSIYFITYDISAIFTTSIGVVHREVARNAHIALDGQRARLIDKDIHDLFLQEKPALFDRPPEDFTGTLPTFIPDATTMKDTVKYAICLVHTKNIAYKARRNNRIYEKQCRPNERDVDIKEIRQVYLPFMIVDFSVLKTKHHCEVFQTSSGRLLVRKDGFRQCGVCDSRIDAGGLLCDTCGRGVHSGGFFTNRIHGFRCNRCQRTTCRADGHWTRKFLVLKTLLCPNCASDAKSKGHNVNNLEPLKKIA